MNETVKEEITKALSELLKTAKLKPDDLLVVGCSSSEIVGETIGHGSSPETAKALVAVMLPILKEKGIHLAAQCCEHLNRALIVEREVAKKRGYEIVNVRPMPKAGGSFATAVYEQMTDPVAVEHVRAEAGLDIGSTLIGMHLKSVAVPVRLSVKYIGKAYLTAARTRPKYIGGERAHYVEET